jgi:hypothetical protein
MVKAWNVLTLPYVVASQCKLHQMRGYSREVTCANAGPNQLSKPGMKHGKSGEHTQKVGAQRPDATGNSLTFLLFCHLYSGCGISWRRKHPPPPDKGLSFSRKCWHCEFVPSAPYRSQIRIEKREFVSNLLFQIFLDKPLLGRRIYIL